MSEGAVRACSIFSHRKWGVVTEPRISHAVLLTSAQISRGFVRLFFILVVARQLGPQQFGVYALLIAVLEMLAVASGSGYTDYLTREAAKDARLGWGLGLQLTSLRLICLLPLAVAAEGVLWMLRYPPIVLLAVGWLSLSLAPRSLSESVQGVLRGIGRYAAYLAVELAFDLALIAAVIFLAVRGGGLATVITTEIIAASAAALTALPVALLFRTREVIRLNRKQLLEKSAVFNVYALVGNLYDRLDVVLLSRLAGDYATGIYNAAYRPLGTIQFLPYGVLYSLLPVLSQNPAGHDQQRRLEKAMGFLLSAAFAAVLATMVFAGPAVKLLLGAHYADSALALKILIWAVILRYVNYALNVRLLAGGHERVFVATSIVCLGVNLIGNVTLIPKYSWRAAAAVTIITEIALLTQNVYWIRRTARTIPTPAGWLRTSVVFALLMVASLAGARIAPPLLIGTACVLLFVGYLYRAGIGEFAGAWAASRGTA